MPETFSQPSGLQRFLVMRHRFGVSAIFGHSFRGQGITVLKSELQHHAGWLARMG